MQADFAMREGRHAVLVDELHRVLDGHHMLRVVSVELVDDGCQGGGLPRARGAGDEYESLFQISQAGDCRRKSQLFHRDDLLGNDPEDGSRALTLDKIIRPKPGQSLDAVGEI